MAEQTVVIRSSHPDLVLDAAGGQVKLQTFTGSPSQLWTFELAGLGTQYIVNKSNGLVMDIRGGVIEHAVIIIHTKHGGANQKWYINSDKTIVSSTGNLAVDIVLGNYVPGTNIIAYPKHGQHNQQFTFENQ